MSLSGVRGRAPAGVWGQSPQQHSCGKAAPGFGAEPQPPRPLGPHPGYGIGNNWIDLFSPRFPRCEFCLACPPDETFNQCGTACEGTCQNQFPFCNKKCVPGCFCRPSFVRAPAGNCIHPKWCPDFPLPPDPLPSKIIYILPSNGKIT